MMQSLAVILFTPFHSHNSLDIAPISSLFSVQNAFLLYLDANTIYLQFHIVYSRMVKKVEKVECALLETKIVTNDGNVTQKEFDDAINTLQKFKFILCFYIFGYCRYRNVLCSQEERGNVVFGFSDKIRIFR